MFRRLWAPGLTLLLLTAASPQPAGSQTLVGFQGRLTDASGNPVNATVTAVFTLYDQQTGGTVVWTESRNVAVTGGLYSVLLGEGTALDPAEFNKPLWLGVAVNGDPEMSPRYRLASAPYALMAKQAESVSGLQGRPVSAAAPTAGQVLKWDGAAWAPAADAGTTYSAGDGLALTGSTFAASYAGSGGDLGAALSLARSDHAHDARYYTETEVDTALAGKLSLSGGTISGDLAVTGSLSAGSLSFSGALSGDGSGLTSLNASALASGTVPAARLSGTYAIDVSGNAAGFTGSLAGDVTGTQGATSVVRLQGRGVAATAPAAGQALKWDGSAWAPGTDAGMTYDAGNGLTLTGSTFAASYAGSGGDLGSALSLARSDHLHDGRYYTEGEVDTALSGKVSKAGDTMTGALEITAPGAGLTVTNNVAIGGTLTVVGNAASTAIPSADSHFVTLGYANSNFIRSGTYVISKTAVLDFDRVSNNSTSDLQILDVTDVQPGDTIALGIPPEVMPAGVFVIAFVSAPNTVTVRYGVIGIGGGHDPPSATFRVTVFRYN